MPNEFNIKNGFISNDNSRINGGLTATTISATTYQNLPSTPFLPLSGGTLTGPLVVQANFNPFLITTTNYSPGSAGNILFYGVFTGSTNGFSLNSRSNGGGASGNLILQASGNGNVGVNKNTTDVLNYNLDVNGSFGATSVSATTYQNLPATPFLPLSGGTLTGPLVIQGNLPVSFLITTTNYSPGSAGNIIFYEVFTGSTNGFAINSRLNGGGASGNLILQSSGNGNVGVNKSTSSTLNYNLDVNGSFGATSVSATTYFNLPTDIRVTGGTYSNGTATFTNNTGGTFNVTGLYTGGTDVFVTGATKSGNVATFTNNTGGTFTLTGLTDTFVTGGTYDTGTSTITFTNNSGGTFNVSGITSSGGGSFTGGTVSGATIFTGGLTSNSISATTITSPSISPYGLIVATSLGYQNIF